MMLRATSKNVKRKRRVRFPDIIQDARALGVDRVHLYRVLVGQRRSHSLLARYCDLKKRKPHHRS